MTEHRTTSAQGPSTSELIDDVARAAARRGRDRLALATGFISAALAALVLFVVGSQLVHAATCDGCGRSHGRGAAKLLLPFALLASIASVQIRRGLREEDA